MTTNSSTASIFLCLLTLGTLVTTGLSQGLIAPPDGMMPRPGPMGMEPGIMPPDLAAMANDAEADDEADEGVSDEVRDPFWPIGWVPSAKGATNDVDETEIPVDVAPELTWPEIVMKGVVRAPNGDYMARLEGIGWVKTGYTISMKRDGYIFKWKINKVTDEAISVKKLEASPIQ